MTGMRPWEGKRLGRDLTLSKQYKSILNKITLRSDYKIPARKISRGVMLSRYRASNRIKKTLGVKGKEEVFLPAEAELNSITPGYEKSIQPFYLGDQIDSFYHEDKPAGKLILDAKKSAVLEDGIFMNRRKIVSVSATRHPKFAWVELPYFMDGHAYYIDPEGIDPRYLVAILNSSLMWFWLVYGAKRTHGKVLKIDAEAIKLAPLVKPDDRIGSLLIRLSNEASNLKKARRGFLDIWKNYSEYMMSESVKLREILAEDKKCSSEKRLDDRWTSKTAFHSTPEIHHKSFENLVIEADPEKKSIMIYGQNERGPLIGLFEIVFIKKELMLHVYCALNDPYAPPPITLAGLLNRNIPILRPDPAKQTIEIVKAVSWDFRNYVSAEKLKPHDFRVFNGEALSIPKDLFSIEKGLNETLEKIDFVVFTLYGLSKEEARTILNSLRFDSKYGQEVIDHLSSIDPRSAVEELLHREWGISEHEEAVCNHEHDNC
ncbi:MAG: hypothetical protein FJZ49_01120 [Candidatus Verstraetearchaeota archaeon]|nr:hypothetical protein [Candidatus Verstraetearchaeota archaeon]